CGASCVDTATHPDHCGACDVDCAGAVGASGLCMAGTCRVVCDPLEGDCDADLANGCETGLASNAANCGACGRSCAFANAVGGCSTGACSIASCETGYDDCDGALENGCEADLGSDAFNCGACGTVCGAGEGCLDGACALIHGEDCTDAAVLAVGTNVITWTAATNDYLTSRPSCTSSDTTGPDVVLSYTATADEAVTFTITKPTNTRWVAVLSTTCGAVGTPDACVSDYTDATMGTTVLMTAGQTIYLHVADTTSGSNPLDNPLTIDVTAVTAPCTPGAGGVIGTTTARVGTGIGTSFTEYFVAADESPTGYVYVGSTTALYRMPKAGGAVEDIEATAGLAATHLGYEMLIDGSNIYLVDDNASAVSGRLWRISTDGGTTWTLQDYAFFPTAPADDFRGATVYGGRIYLVTEEDTSTTATQIWSINAAATTLPAIATLELSIAGESDCMSLARDSTHFYLMCDDSGDRIVRVPVGGGVSELVTMAIGVSSTSNALYGEDLDADGAFDVLYAHADTESVSFVCDPNGAMPFAAPLVDLGGGTSNFGMGFDRTAGVLWTFDDDTREFVSVQ
ncbi:MAG: hypothetical protein M3Q72_05350, partial [Actinomycetota bacterium]|nr:hypothetical protein [Actinomycetota bacterium]